MSDTFVTRPEKGIDFVICEKTGSTTWTCNLRKNNNSIRTLYLFDRLEFKDTEEVSYREPEFKEDVCPIGDQIIADYTGLDGMCWVKKENDMRILECWNKKEL